MTSMYLKDLAFIQKKYIEDMFANEVCVITKANKKIKYIYNGKVSKLSDIKPNPSHKNGYIYQVTKDIKFQTKFGNFVEDENGSVRENGYIIVGPLNEIYKAGNDLKQLEEKYERIGQVFKPKGEPLKAIKITKLIFNNLKNSKLFSYRLGDKPGEDSKNGVIEFPVLYKGENYGSVHVLQINDYIMLDSAEFYRIYSKAFKITYDVEN